MTNREARLPVPPVEAMVAAQQHYTVVVVADHVYFLAQAEPGSAEGHYECFGCLGLSACRNEPGNGNSQSKSAEWCPCGSDTAPSHSNGTSRNSDRSHSGCGVIAACTLWAPTRCDVAGAPLQMLLLRNCGMGTLLSVDVPRSSCAPPPRINARHRSHFPYASGPVAQLPASRLVAPIAAAVAPLACSGETGLSVTVEVACAVWDGVLSCITVKIPVTEQWASGSPVVSAVGTFPIDLPSDGHAGATAICGAAFRVQWLPQSLDFTKKRPLLALLHQRAESPFDPFTTTLSIVLVDEARRLQGSHSGKSGPVELRGKISEGPWGVNALALSAAVTSSSAVEPFLFVGRAGTQDIVGVLACEPRAAQHASETRLMLYSQSGLLCSHAVDEGPVECAAQVELRSHPLGLVGYVVLLLPAGRFLIITVRADVPFAPEGTSPPRLTIQRVEAATLAGISPMQAPRSAEALRWLRLFRVVEDALPPSQVRRCDPRDTPALLCLGATLVAVSERGTGDGHAPGAMKWDVGCALEAWFTAARWKSAMPLVEFRPLGWGRLPSLADSLLGSEEVPRWAEHQVVAVSPASHSQRGQDSVVWCSFWGWRAWCQACHPAAELTTGGGRVGLAGRGMFLFRSARGYASDGVCGHGCWYLLSQCALPTPRTAMAAHRELILEHDPPRDVTMVRILDLLPPTITVGAEDREELHQSPMALAVFHGAHLTVCDVRSGQVLLHEPAWLASRGRHPGRGGEGDGGMVQRAQPVIGDFIVSCVQHLHTTRSSVAVRDGSLHERNVISFVVVGGWLDWRARPTVGEDAKASEKDVRFLTPALCLLSFHGVAEPGMPVADDAPAVSVQLDDILLLPCTATPVDLQGSPDTPMSEPNGTPRTLHSGFIYFSDLPPSGGKPTRRCAWFGVVDGTEPGGAGVAGLISGRLAAVDWPEMPNSPGAW